MGVTILGVTTDERHEKIEPGMEGSNITISDFSAENNSLIFNKKDFKEEIISEVLSRIDYIKAFAENSKEGGKTKEMDKFNELLAKYNKTVDDINFEYENMSDEELEVAFANAFETAEYSSSEENENSAEEEDHVIEMEASDEEVVEEETVEETAEEIAKEFGDDDQSGDESGDESGDDSGDDDESGEDETDDHQSVSAIEDEDSTGTRIENSLKYSVTIDGVTKEFAVSLKDKINAISVLVNDTYAEADGAWYDVDVYEDDGRYCVMHDWWNDRHYRQEYSVKKDIYTLKGDRVQVYAQYLTQDQINKIDQMKSDFSAIETELNSYKAAELHSQREAVLAADDYSVMADFADFNDLKSHMDEYSVEDLTNKADLIYAKYMKSNYSNFATKNEDKHHVVFMTSGDNKEEERLPYGGLFKNFKNKK